MALIKKQNTILMAYIYLGCPFLRIPKVQNESSRTDVVEFEYVVLLDLWSRLRGIAQLLRLRDVSLRPHP